MIPVYPDKVFIASNHSARLPIYLPILNDDNGFLSFLDAESKEWYSKLYDEKKYFKNMV